LGFFQDDFDLDDPSTELGSRDGGFGVVVSETSYPDPHRENEEAFHSFSSNEGQSAEFSARDALGQGLDSQPQRSSKIKFSEK